MYSIIMWGIGTLILIFNQFLAIYYHDVVVGIVNFLLIPYYTYNLARYVVKYQNDKNK